MSPPLTMLGMSGPVNTLSSAVTEGEGGGTGTAQITFRYHMYGADMGTVYLYWEVGSTYELLWSKTGQQHLGHTYAWTLGSSGTLLDGKAGETGRFVFVNFKPANKGYRGDAAFCDIFLTRSTASSTAGLSGATLWRTTASNSSVSSLTSARSRSTSNSVPTNSNNTWCYDGGGPTPSSNTGPDKHHNNLSYYDYIYFEASGSSSSVDRYYTMRTASSYTL